MKIAFDLSLMDRVYDLLRDYCRHIEHPCIEHIESGCGTKGGMIRITFKDGVSRFGLDIRALAYRAAELLYEQTGVEQMRAYDVRNKGGDAPAEIIWPLW